MTPLPVTPNHATIGRRGARLLFALCLAALASCSKTEPTEDELVSRADAAFAAGQWDKAETDYRKVLSVAPEDPAALRQLGVIYLDQGQIVQAYPLLKKSADLQPDDPEIQLKLGLISLAAGNYRQAREAALQVLEKRPVNEQALLLLADASRTPDAIEDARKLIQSLRDKDQDRARYHLALGSLDLRQNEQARAEREFKAAVNLDPKSSDAMPLWVLSTGAATISKKPTKLSKPPSTWRHRDLPCGYDMRTFSLKRELAQRRKISWKRPI